MTPEEGYLVPGDGCGGTAWGKEAPWEVSGMSRFAEGARDCGRGRTGGQECICWISGTSWSR